jgi:hypothetical protein
MLPPKFVLHIYVVAAKSVLTSLNAVRHNENTRMYRYSNVSERTCAHRFDAGRDSRTLLWQFLELCNHTSYVANITMRLQFTV